MDPLVIVLGIMLAGLVGWAWRTTRRLCSDEMFDQLPPGLTPAAGEIASTAPAPGGEYNRTIAVAFNPPKARAGLAGTVVNGDAEPRQVLATIVDLAVRGFLTLTIVEDPARRSGRDWELRAAEPRPSAPIAPAEDELLTGIFADGPVVRLGELPRRSTVLYDHRLRLVREAYEDGWLLRVRGMLPSISVWIVSGGVLVTGLATGGPILAGVGAAGAAGGFVIATLGHRNPVRTAEGSALRIQSLAFKMYLSTAEKEQFAFEEAAGIFSRYLPYAIAFGVAHHWTAVFGEIAEQARAQGRDHAMDLPWLGVSGWGMDGVADLGMLSGMDGVGIGGAFDPGGLDGGGGDFGGGGFGDMGGGGGGGD